MMGSSATSLSSMLDKKIDISTPNASLVTLDDTFDKGEFEEFLESDFVKITFKMEIGDLVDSEIMQLYPINFAKELYNSCYKWNDYTGCRTICSGNQRYRHSLQ